MPKVKALRPHKTSLRTQLAISAGLSHDYNPRNLEEGYYLAYHTVLTELFDAQLRDQIFTRSRTTISVSSAELERLRLAHLYASHVPAPEQEEPAQPDGKQLTRTEQLMKNREKTLKASEQKAKQELTILLAKGQEAYDKLVKVRHDAEDPKDALENTSFTSQGTVADGGSLNIVPDFTGYHLVALKELKPTNKDRLYAWKVRNKLRIIHECSPFFLENKTSPTRHKPNYIVQRNIWDQDLEDLLTEAAEDLMFYCCVYLAKDLSAKSVVVMVASGFHWRWVQFSRDEIPEMEFDVSVEELRKRNPAWKVKAVFDAAVRKLANAKIFVLGTEASDRELTAMRDATISIVNNHKKGSGRPGY
ncbi:hypothetical protein PLEOSDRAFT_153853 [Pleurotus ostreatus PC15]|uniref:Uncharacterized protein n=1 Tax=Pleurotus ostreatus (strain PC15) TaxID=1137138 RepID=A0A067NXA0_PLEO1|nr:hypothetical protein PLEOSDRAFT_153853 [Pleurotus ostreatus PC15]